MKAARAICGPSAERRRSPALRGLATAAVLAVAAAAAIPPVTAAAAQGATTVALNGPGSEALRASGVRIGPLKPATGGPRRLVLPIATGLAGTQTALLRHRGGIALSAGGQTLRMTKLRLALGKRPRLSAKLSGREIDVFKLLGGSRRVDPSAGTVALSGSRLRLTRAAAAAIAERLLPPAARNKASEWTARPAGSISARARDLLASSDPTANGPADGKPAASSGCPLPGGAGPAPEDPLPVATRPAAAVDVTSATIDWHVRESFIRYIGTGEGTSVSGGATANPPVQLPGTSAPLSYGFHFPFAEGWHDAGSNPADPADDSAAIEFGGAVRFLYSDHGIDLTTASPEIEIAGAKSRAIFTISEDGGPGERQVLVDLDLGHAAAIVASDSQLTYERVPAAIPSGTASSVFAGFYAPGTEFGCVTVSFATGS